MAKAIEITSLETLIKESELIITKDDERAFDYNLNEKTAKNKLMKGAKRTAFEIVKNSSSSNLIFNLGTWANVVLPLIRYWNGVKGECCKVGETVIKIADVKSGKNIGGKHIDTQDVFFANRDKIVMHFYNTTQLVLVNGHGYDRFIDIFLRPFLEAKIDSNLEVIKAYNNQALEALGGSKMVKRSSVKYTEGPTHLWCVRCDFAAKSRAALLKHKKTVHALNINSNASPSTSLAIPIHQSSRNNSISEGLLNENITLGDISNNEEIESLKYTCLSCDYKTKLESNMDKHLNNVHKDEAKRVNFICGTCKSILKIY